MPVIASCDTSLYERIPRVRQGFIEFEEETRNTDLLERDIVNDNRDYWQ